MATITGSDLISQSLLDEGVDTVFGIAGDHILHLLDKLVDEPFRMIDGRHEAASVHMANAYSRLLRRPGVVLSTTPGHANAVSGLANALHAEAPVVNIVGSANSANLGRGAMQEFDQVGVAKPVTKRSWRLPCAERIPEYVALAIRVAMAGRRGPVHLTIPEDVQMAEVDEAVAERYKRGEYGAPRSQLADAEQIEHAIELLHSAERPVILAGAGAGATADPYELQRLVETTRIPVFTQDHARALVPDAHPYSMGLGYLPLNGAAQRLGDADVVLLLGQRLDYMFGYGASPPFSPNVRHIMVDPSAGEIGRARSVAVGIHGDVGPVISQLADSAAERKWLELPWVRQLTDAELDYQRGLESLAEERDPIHPMFASAQLRKLVDDDTCMIFDGGDYCHFFRASFKAERPSRWLYVSSFGMIGIGLPYALGAKAALPDKQVVLVVGDGSFGFHAMELDTAVRHNLDVTVLVGNNSTWGIDWHIQKDLYGRPVWTDLLPTRYDSVAAGLGAYAENVTRAADLSSALKRALSAGKPAVVNLSIDPVKSPVAEAAVNRKLGSHG